ncbi:MAG TPA: hypothetical protein VD887_03055 [Allosphingosinicella sp.]|nr:hypothetical protein [Allosphingosinicella sp.]
MIGKALASAAALGLAVSPCAAAELGSAFDAGQRRSGATAGVYFAVPFGGQRSGRAQAGLRLQSVQDYRDASGARTRQQSVDTFELRLLGEGRPTLFVAERPVTGRDARRNLTGGGGILNLVVIGLAVVGAFVIYKAIDDDDEDGPA